MNKNFENRDFEHFVKQNADQYRMFPSEKVWKGINNTLHTRRRWYGIGLALLLLSTAAVTGIMLSPSSKQKQTLSDKSNSVSLKNAQPESPESEIIITPIKANKKNIPAISPDNTQKNLFTITTIAKTNTTANTKAPVATAAIENIRPDDSRESEIVLLTKPIIAKAKQPVKSETTYTINKKDITPLANVHITNIKSASTETIITDLPNEETGPVPAEYTTPQEKDMYPMTIESVFNTYKNNRTSKKIVWQMHVIPSITYRKLNENNLFLVAANSSSSPNSSYSTSDINSVVKHKPDIGIQLGVSAGVPVSKTITLTAGLQFNVSKYNIQATTYGSEIATIVLTNSYGRATNVVSTVTNLRNVGGYRASWLHNKYISASLPVGAEVKLSGKNKTIIGIGATIQPTYILGNRAYLLSTDLKNYARVPSLTRKWNINTGFELFAGYSTGKIDWRIGPHVRYQLYSSFYNTYPIKEHLFDFGVKLGITLK